MAERAQLGPLIPISGPQRADGEMTKLIEHREPSKTATYH